MFATSAVHAVQFHSLLHFLLCLLLRSHSAIPHLPPCILLIVPHVLEHYRKGVLVVCNTCYEHLHCKLKDTEDMQRSVLLLSYSAINSEFMYYFVTEFHCVFSSSFSPLNPFRTDFCLRLIFLWS